MYHMSWFCINTIGSSNIDPLSPSLLITLKIIFYDHNDCILLLTQVELQTNLVFKPKKKSIKTTCTSLILLELLTLRSLLLLLVLFPSYQRVSVHICISENLPLLDFHTDFHYESTRSNNENSSQINVTIYKPTPPPLLLTFMENSNWTRRQAKEGNRNLFQLHKYSLVNKTGGTSKKWPVTTILNLVCFPTFSFPKLGGKRTLKGCFHLRGMISSSTNMLVGHYCMNTMNFNCGWKHLICIT